MVVSNSDKAHMFDVNPRVVPVPVIATFSKDGDVRPLYFSAEGIRIKVDNIKWKQQKMAYIEFRCEITLSDRVEEVRLYYYTREQIWLLEKK